MGVYGWREGTIVLPASEFAGFRQAIQDADTQHRQQVFDLTQECWKSLTRKQQTDPVAHREAVRQFISEQADAEKPGTARGYGLMRFSEPKWDRDVIEMAEGILAEKTHSFERGRVEPVKPSRVLKSDVAMPTNRTTTFVGPECSVTFDRERRSVTWSSSGKFIDGAPGEGTHLAIAFNKRLDEVRWTHGTGGVISGNDDMRHDDRHAGGGANYVTSAHGYLGIEQAPGHVQPFLNAKGERIVAETTRGRDGVIRGKAVKAPASRYPSAYSALGAGRVHRGVPAGGQFTTRGRGESGVRL